MGSTILNYIHATELASAGTSEGALRGWDTRGRKPTDKEDAHEHMRINNALKKGDYGGPKTQDILLRRLNAITQPQKLYNFYRALEDENMHKFNSTHVLPKMIDMGWNGRHPKE